MYLLVRSVLAIFFKSVICHFQALDALGSTQWIMNTAVLDVLEKIWADGGRLADLVDQDDVRLINFQTEQQPLSVTMFSC